MFEELSALIGNLGFPIAVAAFCLLKLNKTSEEQNMILAELKTIICELLKKIEGDDKK